MLSERGFQYPSEEKVLDRLMELDVEMQFLRSEMEGYESAGIMQSSECATTAWWA